MTGTDITMTARRGAASLAWGLAFAFASQGIAQAAEPAPVSVELNKLEAQAQTGVCRAFIVVDNPSDTAFQTFKLDLIFFRTDGVIDRRLAVDLGPMRAAKKNVKSFDLEKLPCEAIGSILVNDAIDCHDATGPVADCLNRVTVSSRAGVAFSK